MKRKYQRTLDAIFEDPVRANIAWRDIEALFLVLGAEISMGSGSRVRVALHGDTGCLSPPSSTPRNE